MTSLRPAWLEIEIDALAHNVRLHCCAAGPDYRGHDGRCYAGARGAPPPDGASAMSAGRMRAALSVAAE
jgi:hypothetical protein